MHRPHALHALLLFVGDLAILTLSVWLMLLIRHLSWPTGDAFLTHMAPFSILFVVWICVYFIAGLYEKSAVLFRDELPQLLFKTQLINIVIAVAFFYAIPFFAITPKTNLFIYLIVSFALILLWRLYGFGVLGQHQPERAVIIGSGNEMKDLRDAINRHAKSGVSCVVSIDLDDIDTLDTQRDIVTPIYENQVTMVAVDLRHEGMEPLLPHLYNLIFADVRFTDMHRLYEEVFDQVPLSVLRYNWFLENISARSHRAYDIAKRAIDIGVSALGGFISLVFYPFIIAAIKLDDGGEIFSVQVRVGQYNKPIRTVKFRTMAVANDRGEWGNIPNEITRVGRFLRKTRLDELPELWNVIRGDMSLIGPRPEMQRAVEVYTNDIPYYNIRHLVKPGLSGWAQIKQDTPPRGFDHERTQEKLSYDLYYVKNRSLWLDIKIVLQTVRTFLETKGD